MGRGQFHLRCVTFSGAFGLKIRRILVDAKLCAFTWLMPGRNFIKIYKNLVIFRKAQSVWSKCVTWLLILFYNTKTNYKKNHLKRCLFLDIPVSFLYICFVYFPLTSHTVFGKIKKTRTKSFPKTWISHALVCGGSSLGSTKKST